VNAPCVDGPCGDGPLWRTRSVATARAGGRRSPLSSNELARAAAISHPAARARFVAGRTLLRELLAEARPILAEEGIELVVERSGRLQVAGHDDLQVSVSHTHGLVAAAAWCRGPVGIDVEPLGRSGLPPGETWLTLQEQHQLAQLPADDDRRRWLLRRWVAKEAVLKAVPSRTVPRRGIELAAAGPHAVLVDETGVPELAGPGLTLHWHVIADRHLVALAY
jgi:4'-phosphopantetheinyl transferase